MSTCPVCEGWDTTNQVPYFDGNSYVIEHICHECGSQWTDYYVYYSSKITKESEDNLSATESVK